MAIDLYLTDACNLRCKFCFNHDDSSAPRIALGDACSILSAAYERGHRYVSITGGEPFIYKPIFQVLDHAHLQGYWIQILTHGGLLTPERITRLQKYWRLRVRISLDGPDAGTHDSLRGDGTFDTTIEAIRRLVEAGINVGVGMTVSEQNIGSVPSVVQLCASLGCAFVRMSPVARVRKGRAANIDVLLHTKLLQSVIALTIEHADRLDLPKRTPTDVNGDIVRLTTRRCMAGSKFFGIMPDSTVIPCPLLQSDSRVPRRTYAGPQTFEQLTNAMNEISDDIAPRLKGICGNCDFREACRGGCLSEKLSFDRDLDDEQPVCTKLILEDLRSQFDSDLFDAVVQSWVAKLRQSVEASQEHGCMRQAPYWSLNFKRSGPWDSSTLRFE